jgi:hypothetical protein
MTQLSLLDPKPLTRAGIVPREYQVEDLDNCFKLWDKGTRGSLTRIFTGGGKTICAALKADRWLARGDDHRVMVLSYEIQLCWQFADELEDVLGIRPQIEMAASEIEPGRVPKIIVASRQTLAQHELATQEQRDWLAEHGITELGLTTKALAKRCIAMLKRHGDDATNPVKDTIAEFQTDYRCNHELGAVSRLFKFDWRLNWLVFYDWPYRRLVR